MIVADVLAHAGGIPFKCGKTRSEAVVVVAAVHKLVLQIVSPGNGFQTSVLGQQIFFLCYTRSADKQCGDCN